MRRLPYEPPLGWTIMLDYPRRRAIPGVEHVTTGSYPRTVAIDGDPGVLEFSLGGPDYVLLRAHLPHWARLTHIVARARGIFSLDADYQGAQLHLRGDPLVGPLLLQHPGLRPPGSWSPFETAVQAILTQGTGAVPAEDIVARLVQRYGKPVPGLIQLGLTHLFPAPAALVDADLSGIGCAEIQAVPVTALARAVADGAVCFDFCRTLADLLASLLAVPGLTMATAHYIALRLGEPDAYPQVSMAPANDRAESWPPSRAYAATYLSHLDRRASAAEHAGGGSAIAGASGSSATTCDEHSATGDSADRPVIGSAAQGDPAEIAASVT